MSQAEVLSDLARRLESINLKHPLRVGIDGIGDQPRRLSAGLAAYLRQGDKPVVEIDSDGFHNPQIRTGTRLGAWLLRRSVQLSGLGMRRACAARSRRKPTYRHRDPRLELRRDRRGADNVEHDAIVLFDCTFLQRGRLRQYWDEVIYLKADPAVARRRGIARDAAARRHLSRRPRLRPSLPRRLGTVRSRGAAKPPALLVIDNTNFDRPRPVWPRLCDARGVPYADRLARTWSRLRSLA